MKKIASLVVVACTLIGCLRPESESILKEGKTLDPIAIAKVYVAEHEIGKIDLASGKLMRENSENWFVSFVYPESKAAGETPHHRVLSINKKTGEVTDEPVQ